MDFNALKNFYYVVKTGSFSKAAEELFVSQSAISQQVKKLENSFKKKLFEKTIPKIILSKFGKELYQVTENFYSTTALFHMNESSFFGESESVTLGFSPIVGSFYAEKIFKSFFVKHPKIQVNIVIDTYSNLVAKLLQREILLFYTGNYIINDVALQGQIIEDIEYGCVTSNKITSYEELKHLCYIRNRSDHLGETYQFLEKIPRKCDLITDSSSTLIKELIKQGGFFKYLPKFYFNKEIESGEFNFFPLRHNEVERKIYSQIIYREENIGDKKLEFFLDFFKKNGIDSFNRKTTEK